jgi:hypothetical protein
MLPTYIDISYQQDGTTLPFTTDIGTDLLYVVVQLLDDVDNIEVAIFDDADSDQADQANLRHESIKTDVCIDLCIELGSGDMIDIDQDANLSMDIDPFVVIDAYVNQNS